jgi:hypothetical protein
VHRFFNITTKSFVESRDVQWMDQMYGDWKGLKDPKGLERIAHIPMERTEPEEEPQRAGAAPAMVGPPPAAAPEEAAAEAEQAEPAAAEAAPPTPQGAPAVGTDTPGRVSNAMRKLQTEYNREASDILKEQEGIRQSRSQIGGAASDAATDDLPAGREGAKTALDWGNFASFESIACLTMLDRLQLSPDELALAATIDPTANPELLLPEQYKDVFTAPVKFQDAWDHPDPFQRKLWRAAINKEFSKMNERKVWRKTNKRDIPQGRRLVRCKWVLEIKRNGIFRARLVACGYTQVGGIDFTQSFSPVVHDVTFRIMLLAKMMWKLDSYLFDVETAFLLGTLEEEIYMECPKGMDAESYECLLLLKTIYGLVQSARQFFKLWSKIMVKMLGFTASLADPCLFTRGTGKDILIVCLYVDDGYCIGKKANILKFFDEIRACDLNITTEESMGDYLSCEVQFNKELTKAWLGQPHMVKKIESTFGEEVSKLSKFKTPGTPSYSLVRPESEEDKTTPERQAKYRSGTGMLLYLVKHSRPDISNAVRELTKIMDGATEAAYKEMLRVIKYVMDTKEWGLKFEPILPKGKMKWDVVVYSDSDWAGDKNNRRSISGFILYLCGVPIMWRSKQQASVSLSSTEAEYVAISEAAKEILFVLKVLKSMGIQIVSPVEVHVDNMGAIYMLDNPSSGGRTRHIDTRFHFVRELCEGPEPVLKMIFVRSLGNRSDGFTKNVTTEIHFDHSGTMVWSKSEVCSSVMEYSSAGRVLTVVPVVPMMLIQYPCQ